MNFAHHAQTLHLINSTHLQGCKTDSCLSAAEQHNPYNESSFICFSSMSRVTMGTLQLVSFLGQKEDEGEEISLQNGF